MADISAGRQAGTEVINPGCAKMAENRAWSSLQLDDQNCLNLEEVLEAFSGPITEQHAWAIIYQAAKSLGMKKVFPFQGLFFT